MSLLFSNALWVPLCLFAIGLIVWDIRYPKSRRFVIAIILAVSLSSTGMLAAEITWDVCEACKQMDYFMWWITFCFLC